MLAFEATEGGAGVLGRLISEPRGFARVARAALDVMHLDNIDAAVAAADPSLLTEKEGADCVKGCYRCLLSYYNQPDHELIDRTNSDVRRVLLRLARSEVRLAASSTGGDGPWIEALARWKLPSADAAPLIVGDITFPLVWRGNLVAAATEAPPTEVQSAITAMGYSVVLLPVEPGDVAPPELVALLGN